jgi:hypothetical protein
MGGDFGVAFQSTIECEIVQRKLVAVPPSFRSASAQIHIQSRPRLGKVNGRGGEQPLAEQELGGTGDAPVDDAFIHAIIHCDA